MKHGFIATLAAALVSVAPAAFADRSTGEYIDDNTVNASVKAALIADKTTKAHEINVETFKGVVQLSGFVESDKEKDAAGKIAKSVDGVKDVRNSISVGPKTSMSEKLDDSVMTGRVKAALMEAKGVKSGQINVETKASVVQLSGFVSSAEMKDHAGKVAAGVKGVKDVKNVLVVRPQ